MKIPTAAEQRQTYLAQLQPHLPEPILAIGFLSTAGYTDGLLSDYSVGKGISMVSPMVGWLFRKRQTTQRIDAARIDLVAVTASSVHLFEYPKRGGAFVVAGPPVVWDRAHLDVRADPKGKYAQPLHVTFSNGETRHFDISNGVRDYATFSDDMRDLLLTPVLA